MELLSLFLYVNLKIMKLKVVFLLFPGFFFAFSMLLLFCFFQVILFCLFHATRCFFYVKFWVFHVKMIYAQADTFSWFKNAWVRELIRIPSVRVCVCLKCVFTPSPGCWFAMLCYCIWLFRVFFFFAYTMLLIFFLHFIFCFFHVQNFVKNFACPNFTFHVKMVYSLLNFILFCLFRVIFCFSTLNLAFLC